jgi:hypothetical protein
MIAEIKLEGTLVHDPVEWPGKNERVRCFFRILHEPIFDGMLGTRRSVLVICYDEIASAVMWGFEGKPDGLKREDCIVAIGAPRFYAVTHWPTGRNGRQRRRRHPIETYYIQADDTEWKGKRHLEENEFRLGPEFMKEPFP